MGCLRLWRRVRVAPGVTLNLSKRGLSTSLGVRGAHVTFGRQGLRRTIGIPGTGIYYTSLHRPGRAGPPPPGANSRRAGCGCGWLTLVVLAAASVIGIVGAAAGGNHPSARGAPPLANVEPSGTLQPTESTSATTPPIAATTPAIVAPATPSSTALPTAPPTAQPTSRPSPKSTPAPTAPPRNTCGAPANPWGYNFCGGNDIYSPPPSFCNYFNCISSFWKSTLGYVDECNDGTYSHSGGRSGACSYHGGELRPLLT
jgi:hypothetical protein